MIALNSPVKPNLNKLHTLLEKINDIGWFTNFGPLHNELTDRLEDYLGVKNLLLTNNGTSALQIAGRALDSRSIISTPFSFVATISAFRWQKDKVSFADIDKDSLNLCPQAVENAYINGCEADTVVATHVYGNPCDVATISELSKQHNLKVIYDAAHAFGIKLNEKSVLGHGDASTLSFHATKIFHTVEGGAIVFKNKDTYERAREIINFGINSDQKIIRTGINAKMNEYQAAVGLVNLDEMSTIISHRAELFYNYRHSLKDIVELPAWHQQANANGAYMPILLDSKAQLYQVKKALDVHGIQSRQYFSPSLDNIFADCFTYGTTNSLQASESILCLPLHSHLSVCDVNNVINVVKNSLKDNSYD